MRTLLLILLLCVACGAAPKTQRSTRVYNSSGKHVMSVSPRGAITNSNGAHMGRISTSGKIYSASGAKIGTIKK